MPQRVFYYEAAQRPNNLARTIMNSKMAQIHDFGVGPDEAKMLFSCPVRDFLPTRANIVCFRRPSISVFLGDRIVCGWVGGHFSLRVAWVSSPPTYLQTINILGSSEFYVKFSTFCCEEPSMLIVCGWVGGAFFMLPAVVFGPPTHLHTFSSFGFSKACLF